MVVSSYRPPARHGRASPPAPKLDPALVELIERRLRAAIPVGRCIEHEDSADLRQSAWLRLLERLEAFENRSSIETFATGVAFHIMREKIGRAVRRRRLEDRFIVDLCDGTRASEASDGAGDEVERRERAARIERLLSGLPDRDRFILRAHAEEEATFGKILPVYRQLFGDHISTVEGLRTLHHDARKTLKTRLRER